MSRRLRLRLAGALALAGVTAACSAEQPPQPEPYAEQVAAALESGEPLPGWDDAAALTGDEGVLSGLAEVPHSVDVVSVGPVQQSEDDGPTTAEVVLGWSWQVGEGPEQLWEYERPIRIELQETNDEEARWTSPPTSPGCPRGSIRRVS